MSSRNISLAFLFVLSGILVSNDASSQERMQYPDKSPLSGALDKDKFSAKDLMQTERGRELVEQLRVLRISEATMGEKHPLLPKIKEDIDQVKGLLRNWAVAEKIADEMDDENEVKQLASVLPGMDDEDLRRLVLRLIIRVNSLEKEVKALKGQSGDQDSPSDAKVEASKARAQMKNDAQNADAGKDGEDLFGENLFDDT